MRCRAGGASLGPLVKPSCSRSFNQTPKHGFSDASFYVAPTTASHGQPSFTIKAMHALVIRVNAFALPECTQPLVRLVELAHERRRFGSTEKHKKCWQYPNEYRRNAKVRSRGRKRRSNVRVKRNANVRSWPKPAGHVRLRLDAAAACRIFEQFGEWLCASAAP